MADDPSTASSSGETAPASAPISKKGRKKDSTAQLAMGIGVVALVACLVAMGLSFLMSAG